MKKIVFVGYDTNVTLCPNDTDWFARLSALIESGRVLSCHVEEPKTLSMFFKEPEVISRAMRAFCDGKDPAVMKVQLMRFLRAVSEPDMGLKASKECVENWMIDNYKEANARVQC